MKRYYCSNAQLNEMLVDKGINLVCVDGDVVISDEDAIRIAELVNVNAPAAIYDYCIEDV